MTHRYNWLQAGLIGQPGKTIKIGYRREITFKGVPNIYVKSSTDVKNGTKLAKIFNNGKWMDEGLKLYQFNVIGNTATNETLGYILTAVKCTQCKRQMTYVEGLAHCEKCDRLAGEFI